MSTLSRSSMNATPDHLTHSLLEDVLAILIGTLLVAFGVTMFKQAGLLTGSTAGIAFLLHYRTGLPFGAIFFVINLPFYWLAWRRMGWRFTLKTFIAVSLLSVFTSMHGQFLHLGGLNPFYTGLVGGLMMGMGFIALFRHQASLGGFNILALYLQDRYGIRAGKLQLGLDLLILATSLLLVSWPALLGSILGAVAMNMVIGFNHRPDRYIAM
ncbi:YitT family protein [Vogesella amnigena]|uniref:YitT family protein n=1 Tax=Vogesella amnigena TaxID=1507449 RepID=A0ABV7TSY7_9NEIS